MVGVRESAAINNVIVVLKIVVLLAFVLFGASSVLPVNWPPFLPGNEGGFAFGWPGVFRAASAIFFAYWSSRPSPRPPSRPAIRIATFPSIRGRSMGVLVLGNVMCLVLVGPLAFDIAAKAAEAICCLRGCCLGISPMVL